MRKKYDFRFGLRDAECRDILNPMISPAQLRAARAWLGMSGDELARLAGCARDTIWRFEVGRAARTLRPSTEAAIRGVLEARGIRFLFGREGGPIGIEGRP